MENSQVNLMNSQASPSKKQKVTDHPLWERRELIAALFSGLLILAAWILQHFSILPFAWPFYLAAFLIGGYAKAKEGLKETIENKDLNVELLMIIAAIGAAVIGHWLEGSMLIFIFSMSGALETYATAKSTKAIESLMSLQPEEARLIVDGEERMVSTSDLHVGNVILIKPGERIPADGMINKGSSSINEAAITGESMPLFKQPGEEVLAGTMNIDGAIYVTVEKEANDSLFSRILELVQNAQSEKAPSQQFIERIEGHYVKIVLGVAVLVLLIPHYLISWTWSDTVYRTMVFLVVASPCALVASTMPAVLSAISFGARQGILVKGGTHLEKLANLEAIAFDKTGTLTNGAPEVIDVHVLDQNTDSFLLKVAALENQSTHPLASAIIRKAHAIGQALPEAHSVKTIPGQGIVGEIDGVSYKVGKRGFIDNQSADALIQEENIQIKPEETYVYVEADGVVIGLISLKDSIRKTTPQAIQALHSQGLHTVMLTGDSRTTAEVIAKEVGVSEYFADLLPDEKVNMVKKLGERYASTAMIGDGINDTPALATASVGIAMGEGTEAALETADIVLVKNDLEKVAQAIKLSKKMNTIVKQNIVFSLSVIALLIISNFSQIINITVGVICHEGSTILVILNGLRLLNGPKKF